VEAADEVVVLSEGRVHGPMSQATLLQDHDLLRRAGLRADPEGAVPAPASPSAVAAEPRIRERPWLARRNPTVLLGLLTALSIACIALTDPAPLAVLYVLLAAGAMLGCRLGPVRMLRAQLPFLAFAVGVFSVNVLSRPGYEPWPELPVRITQEGIVLGAALALRALVIGLGAVVVTRATDPRTTVVSLQQRARLPSRYAYALLAGGRVLGAGRSAAAVGDDHARPSGPAAADAAGTRGPPARPGPDPMRLLAAGRCGAPCGPGRLRPRVAGARCGTSHALAARAARSGRRDP